MIIQRALERAKQLQEARDAERRKADDKLAEPATRVSGADLPHADHMPLQAPPEGFPVLERVNLDPVECERNRIILGEGLKDSLAPAEPAYRLLRGRVQHAISAGNWSCIGITSPGPGEGKTVTSLNLALSIAREKQRQVVLLDLDMRNPSVLKYVGATPAVQISEYFQGSASAEQVLSSTNVENLLLAGNREPIEGASELLATQALRKLLAYIHTRTPGALVVIDLPPVTSTDEALQVAPRVDAMFVVVCEGMTRRDSLTRALNLLSDFRIAGIILNRSTAGGGRDYKYYYRF